MYYPDLSPYQYIPGRGSVLAATTPLALNVGWLDAAYPFPQAAPSPALVARLWAFCRTPVNIMLGWHDCPFCADAPETYLSIEQDGERLSFGHAEIWVFGPAGRTYAAPTLIYHYMTRHHYQPPEEFAAAILTAPLPSTPDYAGRAGLYRWGAAMLQQKQMRQGGS